MKKIILSTIAILSFGAISVFANGPIDCQQMPMDKLQYGEKQCQKPMDNKMPMMKHKTMNQMSTNKGMATIQGFDKLNLSDEQNHKLAILKEEMKLEMLKSFNPKERTQMETFITSNGTFDKTVFMNSQLELYKKHLEIKATYFEKALQVLSKEQIEILKQNMSRGDKQPSLDEKHKHSEMNK